MILSFYFITNSTPMTKTNTKAFTLIELLIVIVIIGILAVALIPRLTGSQATARDTARKATLQQVATVISAYVNSEQSPVALTNSSTPVALDTTSAVAILSGYGNVPTTAANSTIFIASGGNNQYVVSVQMERGQGNVAGTGAATGWVIPGQITSAASWFAIRAQ